VNNPANKSQTRVLIVDDSAFMRTALSRMVAFDPDLSVVGTAANGNEALQQISVLNPDVITMDVQMPGLDGLATLRRIMVECPRPVIMVSSLTQKDADATFTALAAGAFDYVPKQLAATSLDILHIREDLIAKIKAAAESALARNHVEAQSRNSVDGSRKPPARAGEPTAREDASTFAAIVAIGISTGGPKALQDILPSFPADISVPILVVQHMPPGFTAPLAKRLNSLSQISICEATHGEPARAGVVYIAPAGYQMTIERPNGSRVVICLSDKPESQLHVPSANVLMESVASEFRSLAMGVIMTGMGSDGAQGMSAIHREGGMTLGQDEASCAVYGMPRACAELGILDRVVPLSRIPHEILQATGYRRDSMSLSRCAPI
jgi:two-component system, chemotaxis family, protein-glutamate methylesterase/glutaminase